MHYHVRGVRAAELMADNEQKRSTADEIIARLEHLERVMQSNTARLHAIESRLRLDEAKAPPVERAPTVAAPRAKDDDAEAKTSSSYAATEAGAPKPSDAKRADAKPSDAQTPKTPKASSAETRDFETIVGGSWFNWAGMLAFAFAVAFFLKYAFDHQWISPVVRVALGAASGVALLFMGGRLRRRGLRQYAFVLTGGGILILYLAIYAAYDFYRLVNQPSAFLLMVVVTLTAVLLAASWNALPIAVLGLIGGFLTPLLLSTGRDNQLALFTYVALLDAGVLALAYLKRWRLLNFLSFAATWLVIFGWMSEYYASPKRWTTLAFITLFFVIYAALAVVHNLLPRRPARTSDLLLVIFNATLYFVVSYALIHDLYGRVQLPAAHALILSALFAGLFHMTWKLNRDDRLLLYAYAGAAVTFVTIAIAIQMDLHWATIAWATEALMLVWVGVRARERAVRHIGLAVFVLAVGHWFFLEVLVDLVFGKGQTLLFNHRMLSCAVLVGALAGSARLYRGAHDAAELERKTVVAALVVVSNLLALAALSAEAIGYFEKRIWAAKNLSTSPDSPSYAEGLRQVRELRFARQLSLSIVWALYGGALLVAGRIMRVKLLRVMALVLLALTTFKVFFWDLSSLERVYRIVSFIVLGLILLAVSYLYQKNQRRDRAPSEAEA